MGIELTIAGLVVSAFGAYQQYQAGQEQKDAMQRSAAESRAQVAAQQRMADIKNARERANLARQNRIARGALANLGANKGVSSSTGVVGGLASLATQGASNLGIFGALEANQQDILASQERQGSTNADASSAQIDTIRGGTIFSVGSSLFKEGGGFKTIFDEAKK